MSCAFHKSSLRSYQQATSSAFQKPIGKAPAHGSLHHLLGGEQSLNCHATVGGIDSRRFDRIHASERRSLSRSGAANRGGSRPIPWGIGGGGRTPGNYSA